MERHSNWLPDLFVLDLYFPLGEPDQEEIERFRKQPLELTPDRGNMRQAFINVTKADERLQYVLKAWKQERRGGIELGNSVRKNYPNIPIVFYARKATLNDALICMTQPNVVNVIQKPTGSTDEETRLITLNKHNRKRIADLFVNCMNMKKNHDAKKYIERIVRSIDFVNRIV